jgi:hypothetical protein
MSPLATFLAMRRLLPALLAASLVLGACGGDDDGDQAAVTSIPDETSTSTSTTTEPRTVAPDVIPQDASQITEEYVEQVLDQLYDAMLGATEAARAAGVVEERAIAISEATNSEQGARELLNGLVEQAAGGFAGFRDELRPVDTEVVELHEASVDCIFAEARFDFSGLTTEPGDAEMFRLFVRLIPASEEQRASGLNPTAWVLDELPATDDGSVPPGKCSAL